MASSSDREDEHEHQAFLIWHWGLTAGARVQGAGVPLQELDWMVCNGGADIWHLLQSRNGKDPTWSPDEHWDAHITFRQGAFVSLVV